MAEERRLIAVGCRWKIRYQIATPCGGMDLFQHLLRSMRTAINASVEKMLPELPA